MLCSNSFAGMLGKFRPAHFPPIAIVAGGPLLAFALQPAATDSIGATNRLQFAQAKAKAKSNMQKAKAKAKAKADDEDDAKGGATGQCAPGKTFTPGRGRGVGAGGQCT